MQDKHAVTRTFRVALLRLWLWAAAAHLLLMAVIALGIALAGLEIDRVAFASLGVMPAAYWVVYGLEFRLKVSPCGLGWVNRGGSEWFLAWPEIERAERRRHFGFATLAVWSTN